MRITALTTLVISLACGITFASTVIYLHDSPAPPTGNQLWDDQWSGGVANPMGEYMSGTGPYHSGTPPWAVVAIPVDNTYHDDPNNIGGHLFCHDIQDVTYNDGDYYAYLWLKKTTPDAPYETICVSVWDETLPGPLSNLIAGPTLIQITDYTNWNEYTFHLPFVQSQQEPRIVLVVSMLEWENAELYWDHETHNSRLVTPGAVAVTPSSIGDLKALYH